MAERLEVYKCEICGNLVEVLEGGAGELVCCGEAMVLYAANTKEASVEKHVPVIVHTANGIKVKVGSVAHPMIPEHWIQWIELVADGKAYRQFLNPGQPPEAVFPVQAARVTAREFCNLHGLWKAEG
jgi:superoxide reductase